MAPPNVVLKDSLVDIIDGGIIQLQDQKTNVGTVATEKLVPQLSWDAQNRLWTQLKRNSMHHHKAGLSWKKLIYLAGLSIREKTHACLCTCQQ